ncbi:MAG: glycosyltransferase [Clostridia bacterium]|nr:glycosyltransferase [Clostridia bacterium]
MKVLFVNSMCGYASTGRIVAGIYEKVKAAGGSAKVAYGFKKAGIVPECDRYRINSKSGYYFHNILAKLTDKTGLYSKRQTRKLIKFIEQYNPDIVNVHNLHGYYINYELLFDYLAKKDIKVVLTLHDCWLFTGHCAHFDMVGCNGYLSGCKECRYKKTYPKCWFKCRADKNYKLKKRLLSGVKNLTVVTPSKWLADIARQSFLGDREIRVINNGIDLSVFAPDNSDIKARLGVENKKIALAVSNSWNYGKGFDDINLIADKLPDDIKIIMVGLDSGQICKANKKIIRLPRTGSAKELASFYSAANVFLNLTREDTFPTVNIESLACGTPVITYNTGGSPEIIGENCGRVVEKGDIDGVIEAINDYCNGEKTVSDFCVSNAKNYDINDKFKEYTKLFRELLC